jgi:hypothetical protein
MIKNYCYYKAAVACIIEDEETGKLKKQKQYYLIAAATPEQAMEKLKEYMSHSVFEWRLTGLKEENLTDVINNENEE